MASFEKIQCESLKNRFIREIEAKILSGELKPGEKLPPERELAKMTGVSRSIVNSGLVELETKGFVSIIPRKATVVLDFTTQATASMLPSIMNYNKGRFDKKLFNSMMDTRMLIEGESAKLCAKNASAEDIDLMKQYLTKMQSADINDYKTLSHYNLLLHQQIVRASGNMIFTMIFKSFEPLCISLIQMFYKNIDLAHVSIESHKQLIRAFEKKDEIRAFETMRKILHIGRKELELLSTIDY